MEDSTYLKRKVTYGALEPDYKNKAIIVHYDVEASALNEYGETTHTETKSYSRSIRLKSLNENSNIQLLAQDIVDRCNFIHASRVPELTEILYNMQAKLIEDATRGDRIDGSKPSRKKRDEEPRKRSEDVPPKAPEEVAKMDDLDSYMELLYDDEPKTKLKGVTMIQQLSNIVGNLELLIQNDALMGALSRVLKEEMKKNADLSLAILHVFYNFSVFSNFHTMLLSYHLGDLCMKILEQEHRRAEVLNLQIEFTNKIATARKRGDTELENQLRNGNDPEIRKEIDPAQLKLVAKALAKLPAGDFDLDGERVRIKETLRKQEPVLFATFSCLLNLAEDNKVERKMCKRGLVGFLVPMLDRPNARLLLLVINFLRKLSIYDENVKEMSALQVVERLCKFVPSNQELVLRATLRLLFNLSFDVALREVMVQQSLIPKLVNLLKLPPFRAITLRLMYHISQDDRCKSEFTYTEAIPLVMQLIVHFPETFIAQELVALAVNLSANPRNAELMVQGQGLRELMSRVFKTKDWLLMKVVRNISQWTLSLQADLGRDAEYKQDGLWAPYIRDMFRFIAYADRPELLVEVVGTLANMTTRDLPPEITFADMIIEHNLLDFFYKNLVVGFAEDDIVLECVMLLGTVASDEHAAPLLASSTKLVRALLTMMAGAARARARSFLVFHVSAYAEKQHDGELVLQSLFTMYRMLEHKETAQLLIYQTEAVNFMCRLLDHRHVEIARIAEQCVDIVMAYDRQYGPREIWQRLQQLMFERHNAEWLAHVAREDSEDAETKAWAMQQAGVDHHEYSPAAEDWNKFRPGHAAAGAGMDLGYSHDSESWQSSPQRQMQGGHAAGDSWDPEGSADAGHWEDSGGGGNGYGEYYG